jgi:hypothetical protein
MEFRDVEDIPTNEVFHILVDVHVEDIGLVLAPDLVRKIALPPSEEIGKRSFIEDAHGLSSQVFMSWPTIGQRF